MKLFWTPEAVRDREEIYEYISADSPESALTLDELFEEKQGICLFFPPWGVRGASTAPGNSWYIATTS